MKPGCSVSAQVSYHVKKRHLMAMKDYTTKYGRAMIYEEKHTCQVSKPTPRRCKDMTSSFGQVCGSHVLWERSSIYQHIYQVLGQFYWIIKVTCLKIPLLLDFTSNRMATWF